MTRPRLLLTRRWPEAVETDLARDFDVTLSPDDRPLRAEALRQAMGEFDAVLPTVTDRMDAALFSGQAPRVRLLANYGVGVSHIDLTSARAAGIAVTNTPDVLSDCTADIAMTLLLMATRRAGEGEREVRAGRWSGWRPTHLMGTKVSGMTLGIIGFGRIGQAMAQRAHHGFGMRILVQNRSAIAPDILVAYGAEQVGSIDALLPQVDALSLHCPGGDENRHLIDAARLAKMRPGAFVINTARGEVVEEDALAEALSSGALAGAGLDVFDGEPTVRPALLACENAVLLPHLGSATTETRVAMGMRVAENVRAFFAGQTPRDLVT